MGAIRGWLVGSKLALGLTRGAANEPKIIYLCDAIGPDVAASSSPSQRRASPSLPSHCSVLAFPAYAIVRSKA